MALEIGSFSPPLFGVRSRCAVDVFIILVELGAAR